MTTKIFDCSNFEKRPRHRGFGGPVENDVLRYLKKYAENYDCLFVDELNQADVVVTNDVFTDEALASELPKVKRMDGVFSQYCEAGRNNAYNEAAQQADHVIFISKFSQESFYKLCQINLRGDCSVIVNRADPAEWRRITDKIWSRNPRKFVAIATDWRRPEKRLSSLVKFAECCDVKIVLVGECGNFQHPAFESVGYLGVEDTVKLFDKVDAFVNFSYMDAAPKVVCQVAAYGLPIFFAFSGGVHELVGGGYWVQDDCKIEFKSNIPNLLSYKIIEGYEVFKHDYDRLILKAHDFTRTDEFEKMLREYFDVIRKACTNKEVSNGRILHI